MSRKKRKKKEATTLWEKKALESIEQASILFLVLCVKNQEKSFLCRRYRYCFALTTHKKKSQNLSENVVYYNGRTSLSQHKRTKTKTKLEREQPLRTRTKRRH